MLGLSPVRAIFGAWKRPEARQAELRRRLAGARLTALRSARTGPSFSS
jgi:hypothetical protein